MMNNMMKKRLLAMFLVLSMIVSLLPATVLAAAGTSDTPDCYIEGSDGSYTGYNWMGVTPTVGDKDVYVHIVGTIPDGWTMVGGKWTGADYIDITANPLLSKADCENLFTKSLTQTGKVSVGKNAYKKDVSIYRLTVAGQLKIFCTCQGINHDCRLSRQFVYAPIRGLYLRAS